MSGLFSFASPSPERPHGVGSDTEPEADGGPWKLRPASKKRPARRPSPPSPPTLRQLLHPSPPPSPVTKLRRRLARLTQPFVEQPSTGLREAAPPAVLPTSSCEASPPAVQPWWGVARPWTHQAGPPPPAVLPRSSRKATPPTVPSHDSWRELHPGFVRSRWGFAPRVWLFTESDECLPQCFRCT